MVDRRIVWALWLLAALTLASPAPAPAHPLGNFSISQYAGIQIEHDAIALRYFIDMAEIPTFQELQAREIPANPAEPRVARYLRDTAAALKSGLVLEVEGSDRGRTLGKHSRRELRARSRPEPRAERLPDRPARQPAPGARGARALLPRVVAAGGGADDARTARSIADVAARAADRHAAAGDAADRDASRGADRSESQRPARVARRVHRPDHHARAHRERRRGCAGRRRSARRVSCARARSRQDRRRGLPRGLTGHRAARADPRADRHRIAHRRRLPARRGDLLRFAVRRSRAPLSLGRAGLGPDDRDPRPVVVLAPLQRPAVRARPPSPRRV